MEEVWKEIPGYEGYYEADEQKATIKITFSNT